MSRFAKLDDDVPPFVSAFNPPKGICPTCYQPPRFVPSIRVHCQFCGQDVGDDIQAVTLRACSSTCIGKLALAIFHGEPKPTAATLSTVKDLVDFVFPEHKKR